MLNNISKFYFYEILSNLMFFLPIVYIYFQHQGLTINEIFIIEAIYSGGIVLFEIPSGAFADYYGKKLSLIIGCIVWIVSCILFAFGSGFFLFTIAYLFWALGAAFLSGADTALLYDFATNSNQKESFKLYQGNARIIGLLSISFSSIIGGFIANYSERFTFIACAIALGCLFFILLTLPNLKYQQKQTETYFQIIKNSYGEISKSSKLIWLFCNSAIFLVIYKLIQPSTQLYMDYTGLDIMRFGMAGAYLFISGAIGAKFANKWQIIFKKHSYFATQIGVIIGLIIVSTITSKFGFLSFGIIFFVISINSLMIQEDILENTSNNRHATILSFNNLADRFLFIIVSPIWGTVMKQYGIVQLFGMSGLILIIILPIFVITYLRINNK